MELNLRSLEYLVTVVDTGHFTRAAERLHVSGPALSKQIRKLESQLGLTLLDREDHPVRPTPQATGFIAQARVVLAAAEEALAVAAQARRQHRDQLTIGFVLGFAGGLTRPILDGLAAAAPQIRIELAELSFTDQVSAVLRGEVDASFVCGPLRRDPRANFELVLTEPRALVVARHHRLADRRTVQAADLAGEPQIKISDDAVDAEWARWWALDPRPDGSRPHYVGTFHTITEFLELLAGGAAVGITTCSLGAQFTRPDLVTLPIDDVPPAELYLCTLRTNRNAGVEHLRFGKGPHQVTLDRWTRSPLGGVNPSTDPASGHPPRCAIQ